MPTAPNPPNDVAGFGKLGRFCRDILAFAKSVRIDSIEIQEETNRDIPPKAQMQPSPTGTRIILRLGKGGGGSGSLDVADSDGGEVDSVSLLRFEITDPDTEDFLRIADNGGGEAIVKIPTTTVTGAVNGAPSTLVVVTDGEDWDAI